MELGGLEPPTSWVRSTLPSGDFDVRRWRFAAPSRTGSKRPLRAYSRGLPRIPLGFRHSSRLVPEPTRPQEAPSQPTAEGMPGRRSHLRNACIAVKGGVSGPDAWAPGPRPKRACVVREPRRPLVSRSGTAARCRVSGGVIRGCRRARQCGSSDIARRHQRHEGVITLADRLDAVQERVCRGRTGLDPVREAVPARASVESSRVLWCSSLFVGVLTLAAQAAMGSSLTSALFC